MSEPDRVPSTHDWVCATGGALDPPQRRLVRRAILEGYRAAVVGFATWPFHRGAATCAFPSPPDSKLARTAEEAATTQGPALEGHGYRTWLIGTALAQHDGTAVDAELLYITSLLHDAGIVQSVAGQDFTQRSGDLLIDVCRRAGADDDTGRRSADAAVAHATPGLTASDNPIGYYVQWGAMADLAGLRMWDLPRGYVRRAYAAYPSAGVHHEVPVAIRREAKNVPRGRFAMLRNSGMDLMVAASPTRLYGRERGRGAEPGPSGRH
jgi:hypothetical protein